MTTQHFMVIQDHMKQTILAESGYMSTVCVLMNVAKYILTYTSPTPAPPDHTSEHTTCKESDYAADAQYCPHTQGLVCSKILM